MEPVLQLAAIEHQLQRVSEMSRAAELLMNAGAALKEGDLVRAAAQVEAAALAAEPRLRREARRASHTLEELMPLLRRKDAAGPVLRRFRQSLGLSQAQAAEICDVRQDYIAQVEAGRQSMAEAPMRRLLSWASERGAQAIEEGPLRRSRSRSNIHRASAYRPCRM